MKRIKQLMLLIPLLGVFSCSKEETPIPHIYTLEINITGSHALYYEVGDKSGLISNKTNTTLNFTASLNDHFIFKVRKLQGVVSMNVKVNGVIVDSYTLKGDFTGYELTQVLTEKYLKAKGVLK